MLKDNQGVATVDLLFATLIAMIIIGSLISIIGGETDRSSTAELGRARMVGERVATTINTVYTNGRGYSANITIPSDMDITVDVTTNGFVQVKYAGSTIDIRLVPKTNINSVTMNKG
ncbi:MAG: hypothetical protein KUA29_01220, partial [Methanobacterium sp.]|nr:hypothetical protein [Methanobacterium sp.]